jgi:Fic family protein
MPTLVERFWTPNLQAPGGRRNRIPFKYKAYVPDRIGELDPPLSASAARIIAEADQAVAALNRDMPAVAGLEALARQLLRQESVASSRIEGLVMSHRRLARAAFEPDDDRVDSSARAILNNIKAMEQAVNVTALLPQLAREHVVEIHRTLMTATTRAHIAGVVRTSQNWIGGNNHNPRGAEFIPPPESDVERLLDDLCAFLNRDDLPATLQAAVGHAQFETIHPFADGNGRVGRCLIHVVFRRAKLAPRYVPPISLVLASQGDDYVRGLTAYREEHLEDWCLDFASTVIEATREARRLASDIGELQHRWRAQAGQPRRDSATARLIDALPGQPIVDVATAARATGASEEAARRAVNALETAGVLKQVTVGRRNRAWESVGLFDLLNAFERDLAEPAQTPDGDQDGDQTERNRAAR